MVILFASTANLVYSYVIAVIGLLIVYSSVKPEAVSMCCLCIKTPFFDWAL